MELLAQAWHEVPVSLDESSATKASSDIKAEVSDKVDAKTHAREEDKSVARVRLLPGDPLLAKADMVNFNLRDSTENHVILPDDGVWSAEKQQHDNGNPDDNKVNERETNDSHITQEGLENLVKTLYASNSTVCDCCVDWVRKKPFAGFEEEKDDEEGTSHILTCRREPHGGFNKWKLRSIDVTGSRLRQALKVVFDDYATVNLDELDVTFKAPFIPFCHRWEKLLKAEEESEDGTTKKQLAVLRSILEPEIRHSLREMESFNKTGQIRYTSLGVAFLPGEIVINAREGILCAGILREMDLKKFAGFEYYKLTVSMLHYDGQQFGALERSWTIDEYSGARQLTSLGVYPLRVVPDRDNVERYLHKRGRKFESLQGTSVWDYSGKIRIESEKSSSEDKTKLVSERVIVDTYAYYNIPKKYSPLELESLEYLTKTTRGRSTKQQLYRHSDESRPDGARRPTLRPLTDLQCVLATPLIEGFSLISKHWCLFEVEALTTIEWRKNTIDDLVLDNAAKRMLIGITSLERDDAFDDFVPGKGQGIVILLCGPPGVGKTLTAECLSEHIRRPLYRLGMNTLGSAVESLEPRLKEAFESCARWNAILLLDEADVFLGERSINNLERNELVSVFLQTLEYYRGAIILTSNRATVIDPAFESRIDLILAYEVLSTAARAQIWRNFVAKLDPQSQITEEEILEIAEISLNGRQIKSAIKTARLLALSEGSTLEKKHLDIVIDLRQKTHGILAPTI